MKWPTNAPPLIRFSLYHAAEKAIPLILFFQLTVFSRVFQVNTQTTPLKHPIFKLYYIL